MQSQCRTTMRLPLTGAGAKSKKAMAEENKIRDASDVVKGLVSGDSCLSRGVANSGQGIWHDFTDSTKDLACRVGSSN
jgi:hypothetical protein